jgi:hypothetical protein
MMEDLRADSPAAAWGSRENGMMVYGSSMENLVDYAGALFRRASNYLSHFGGQLPLRNR